MLIRRGYIRSCSGKEEEEEVKKEGRKEGKKKKGWEGERVREVIKRAKDTRKPTAEFLVAKPFPRGTFCARCSLFVGILTNDISTAK